MEGDNEVSGTELGSASSSGWMYQHSRWLRSI